MDMIEMEDIVVGTPEKAMDEEEKLLPKHSATGGKYLVQWENLGFTAPKTSQEILDEVSGIARPGEVLAIMGPSGAGKTTLLDLISGKVKYTSGTLLVNGRPRQKGLKYISAYVEQSDFLISSLTVLETIEYAARLKLPSSISRAQIRERVNDVIQVFGLSKCQMTKVGNVVFQGISCGEKRRTSIACELVTDPQIIFLDEPTSGLDSESSFQVMSALSNLAKKNDKTIICTIHQPSSDVWKCLDKVLLLSLGRTIYMGPATDALGFFEEIGRPVPPFFNPPDHYLKVINTDFSENLEEGKAMVMEISEKYRESKYFDATKLAEADSRFLGSEDMSQSKYKHANSVLFQTVVLTERAYRNGSRNILLFWIRAAMFAAMAIFTGTIWLNIGTTQSEVQDRFSVHFFAAAFLCSMTIAVIPAFIEEKNVFDRERRNASYGVLSYVLSNTLMSLPFVLLLAVVFTIIAYPMIGLHRGADKWSKFLLTLFLALYCAESIVLFVSGVFPIFIVALALLAFLTGFFLLVQGFFVAYENLPAFWIWAHYWSYQSYAFENLVYNDFTGLTFSCDRNSDGSCFCAVPSSLNAQCEFTGTDVLSLYDYQNTNFWLKTGILVIQIVTYRLLFYVILRIKKK